MLTFHLDSLRNIKIYELDCVNNYFPRKSYDIVVFDGSIGHFNHKDINIILKKTKKL